MKRKYVVYCSDSSEQQSYSIWCDITKSDGTVLSGWFHDAGGFAGEIYIDLYIDNPIDNVYTNKSSARSRCRRYQKSYDNYYAEFGRNMSPVVISIYESDIKLDASVIEYREPYQIKFSVKSVE